MSSVFSLKIGMVGDSKTEFEIAQTQLGNMGFNDISEIVSFRHAEELLGHLSFRLMFVDDERKGKPPGDALGFVKRFSTLYPNCRFVLLTDTPSFEHFLMGALSGLTDYLYKSEHMDLGKEAMRLLTMKTAFTDKPFNAIQELGFFRTLGLTKREFEVLEAYMNGFPRYQELSVMVGKSTLQVRKMFSSIYSKLDIDNPAQLAHLLTIAVFLRTSAIR